MEDKWMELAFNKRVCCRYVRSRKNDGRCSCGQEWTYHTTQGDANVEREESATEVWNPMTHTITASTDAFGTIDFHDGPHPNKAQYIRLAYDSPSERIVQLLTRGWGLELPKLIISVHGGKANFDLSPRLKKIVQTGLLRAAKTTGAWLLTEGTNTGVTRHVGDALISERSPRLRSGRVVSIGIAPWGVIENRHMLVGCKKDVPYVSIDQPRSKFAVLNNRHAYFLLVDNGTVGHSGAEFPLRRKLEKYISGQLLPVRTHCSIPLVCVVIEGGMHTIRSVLEYVTDSPPVPVVVCEGSGRAADLIAFAYKFAPCDERAVKDNLLAAIQRMFDIDISEAETVLDELLLCVERKNLITIFSPSGSTAVSEETDEEHNLDQAILTSIFTSRHLSSPKQLSLAIAWNRVDIARSEIFVYGQEWPEGALEEAMMDALDKNRIDFVKLLLEKGVQITNFLTIHRLEELYNSKQGPANTLHYIVRDVRPHMPKNYAYTLIDIGLVINKLMGGAYRSPFSERKFRNLYNNYFKRPLTSGMTELGSRSVLDGYSRRNSHAQGANTSSSAENTSNESCINIFPEPFNDLLVWAVLTKRQAMAHLMWQHGEQALAKALIANKLYRAMADEAADDDLEVEISDELRGYANEFENAAIELLDFCYRYDDDLARQILTCELVCWNRQNCLRLAHACNHRAFLAHPCSQIILSDLWMGGLRTRRWTNVKVIISLLFPPMILQLDFKSIEELQLMPQTMEEHLLELKEEHARNSEDTSASGSLAGDVNAVCIEDDVNPKDDRVVKSPDPREPPDVYNMRKKQRQLNLKKKIYEFYAAPIVKFWCHSMAYIAFLLIYTYTLLIKLPEVPAWNEYYVMAYIATFGCEMIHEIVVSEPIKLRQKLWVWLHNWLNACDAAFVLEFFLGLALRFADELTDYGRVFYCLNILYWYIRIPRIFMVSKFLGPFVVIIGRMAYSMMRFVAFMVVAVMAYGVFRQTLLFPYEDWSWHLVRDIFFQPYFMIFGEEFVEEIDPPCGPDEKQECVAGRWLNPVIMAIYLLIAYILLVNLLIAVFNSIFAKANAISRRIWKSSRFVVIMEYEQKPLFPPPLIFVSHIFLIFKWCHRRAKGLKRPYDQGLTLFLNEADLERLYDFEEECMERLAEEKESKLLLSVEERTRLIGERLEGIGTKVTECLKLFNHQNQNLKNLDYRIMKVERVAKKIHAELANIVEGANPTAANAKMALRSSVIGNTQDDPVREQMEDLHEETYRPSINETIDEESETFNNLIDYKACAVIGPSAEQQASNLNKIDSPNDQQKLSDEVDDEENPNKESISDISSDCADRPDMSEMEFTGSFEESEEVTMDCPPSLAISISPLIGRSQSVECRPKQRRTRNYSETSQSPPRTNRWKHLLQRKSLQILMNQETSEIDTKSNLSMSGSTTAPGSPSACSNCQTINLNNFAVPQLLTKTIPSSKIEAEAEHLREMEGHDYKLMEDVIRRRMCRDSEDFCVSLEEIEAAPVTNAVLDSIREITEHIETDGCFPVLPPGEVEYELIPQLQTLSAENSAGTELERPVFARHSSFQA